MGLSSSYQHVSLALHPDRPLPSEQIREEEQPWLQIPNRQVQQASRYFLNGESCNCYDSSGPRSSRLARVLSLNIAQDLKAIDSAGLMYGLKPVPTLRG